jgi:hypothetical protein
MAEIVSLLLLASKISSGCLGVMPCPFFFLQLPAPPPSSPDNHVFTDQQSVDVPSRNRHSAGQSTLGNHGSASSPGELVLFLRPQEARTGFSLEGGSNVVVGAGSSGCASPSEFS